MKSKKIISLIIVAVFILTCSACGKEESSKKDVVTVSYQYGIAYLPIQVVKDLNLIEKYYSGSAQIEWIILNSGQAVNEAFISGDIDIAAQGVAPIITGIVKGVDYRIFSGISSQPVKLMTNQKGISSLGDIAPDSKIAMGSLGSMQHIILAMACEKEFGDAHALDEMVMPLSHPDAMNAVLTGSVDYHVATPPYLFIEEENENISEVGGVSDAWPQGNSFVVGVASSDFINSDPELYEAFVLAVSEAVDYVNDNPEEVAARYCEEQGVSKDTLLKYLSNPGCIYEVQTHGVIELAQFMVNNGFVDGSCPSVEDIFSEAIY